MSDKELYEMWIARKRQADVPEDFSRRVMEALPARLHSPVTGGRSRPTFLEMAALRWTTAAFLLLAGLLRLSYVTACLLIP